MVHGNCLVNLVEIESSTSLPGETMILKLNINAARKSAKGTQQSYYRTWFGTEISSSVCGLRARKE